MLRLVLLLALTLPIKHRGYRFNKAEIERIKRKRQATIAKKERGEEFTLPDGEKATYDPKTKTVIINNSSIGMDNRNKARRNVRHILEKYPETEKIQNENGSGLPIGKVKRALGMEDEPRPQARPQARPAIPSTGRVVDSPTPGRGAKEIEDVGVVEYDPLARIAFIPDDTFQKGSEQEKQRRLEAIERAFPSADAVELKNNGARLALEHARQMLNMGPRPARVEFGPSRSEKERKRGIDVRQRGAFFRGSTGVVTIRRPPPTGEPTEQDKGNVLQRFPEAKTLSWAGKEYPLQPEAIEGKAPLKQFVTVPAGGGKRLDGIRGALDSIDKVHSAEGLDPLAVSTKREKRGTAGSFSYDRKGNPKSINVGSAEHPRTTMAHEMGHYIDMSGLGEKGTYASKTRSPTMRPQGEVANVMNSIDNSPTATRLQEMASNPAKFSRQRTFRHFDGTESTYTETPDARFLEYLNRDQELFARAYAQYIASRSGDPKMQKEMDHDIGMSHKDRYAYPRQWTHEEFIPIAEAFDELFREKGWLK